MLSSSKIELLEAPGSLLEAPESLLEAPESLLEAPESLLEALVKMGAQAGRLRSQGIR